MQSVPEFSPFGRSTSEDAMIMPNLSATALIQFRQHIKPS